MLRSVKEMLNYSILATDGAIGTISDVLVGDSDLKLRYLVIDTEVAVRAQGAALHGRLSSVEPGKETVG